jgi:hypothetical protein
MCNPSDANYPTFYSELAPGSWLEVLPGATHADYIELLNNAVPIPVCGQGSMKLAETQTISAATTVAWLDAYFRKAVSTWLFRCGGWGL